VKQQAVVGGVVLAVLSVFMTLLIMSMNRSSRIEDTANDALTGVAVNRERISSVATSINRIEIQMALLSAKFDKIDDRFEVVQNQMREIMMYLPRRTSEMEEGERHGGKPEAEGSIGSGSSRPGRERNERIADQRSGLR